MEKQGRKRCRFNIVMTNCTEHFGVTCSAIELIEILSNQLILKKYQ